MITVPTIPGRDGKPLEVNILREDVSILELFADSLSRPPPVEEHSDNEEPVMDASDSEPEDAEDHAELDVEPAFTTFPDFGEDHFAPLALGQDPPSPSRSHRGAAPSMSPSESSFLARREQKKRERNQAKQARKKHKRQRFAENATTPQSRRSSYPAHLVSDSVAWDGSIRATADEVTWLRKKESEDDKVPADSLHSRRIYTARFLLRKHRFRLIKWNGIDVVYIVDRDGFIIASLAGAPASKNKDGKWVMSPDWVQCCKDLIALLDKVRKQLGDKIGNNRRGNFAVIRGGYTYGPGCVEPTSVVEPKEQWAVWEMLCKSTPVRRIAGFQISAFKAFGPKIVELYQDVLGRLLQKFPHLHQNFDFNKSFMPAMSINLGEQTVAALHADGLNLGPGGCGITRCWEGYGRLEQKEDCITNAGKFDPTKGGHIYLVECKLVIQFPSGSTIIIPSALIHHGNTPIQSTETRYSLTQYAAGGLFRYVAYGFRSAQQMATKFAKEKVKIDAEQKAHAQTLFSKLAEVASDYARIFQVGIRNDNTAV
uniref:Uncharacterized protein n=1 Tax=Mycena chlorophos TaxID=658473 RepID=A0ABQ0LEH0_MYCCL|nr:predicted protein [Mycena chlorophos]